jgi:hypothetical protein
VTAAAAAAILLRHSLASIFRTADLRYFKMPSSLMLLRRAISGQSFSSVFLTAAAIMTLIEPHLTTRALDDTKTTRERGVRKGRRRIVHLPLPPQIAG